MNHQSVLFLDFDDVLCLNKPFGGYDVLQALSQVVKKTAVLQDFKEVPPELKHRRLDSTTAVDLAGWETVVRKFRC